MVYIASGTTFLQLPNQEDFAVNPRRFYASRRANAGNIIRQQSALHISSAAPTYSGLVDQSDAEALDALHTAGSSVYLTVRGRVFVASLDLEMCEPSEAPGRWQVKANFGIISEVAF